MDPAAIVFLRIAAFIIDFILIMSAIGITNKIGIRFGIFSGAFEVGVLLFICIPLCFLIYWLANVNVGKRLFRLQIISAKTGEKPTVYQYIRRCLLMSLVVSFNIIFILPMLITKRNQGFHDMLANTVVVRKEKGTNA